jgi:uracil-DNA glycosylase family 4
MNPTDINDVSRCSICPELGANHVPSYGNTSADIMIVGSRPYEADSSHEEPFVSLTGRYVDFMLDEIFLDRSEVYLANLVKCCPDRAPVKSERSKCFHTWLKKEIKAVKPKVLVLLGKPVWGMVPSNLQPMHGRSVKTKLASIIFWESPEHFAKLNDIKGFLTLAQEIMNVMDDEEKERLDP